MKEQELNELLDKAIGEKGNLRIPSFWMKKIFKGLMEWCKTLTSKVFVPTKVSQLENDRNYVDDRYVYSAITANKTDMEQSSGNSLYYKSIKGLNYGIIDSSENPFKAGLMVGDLGYKEYKMLAFVKSLKIPEFGIDLPQGTYLFTLSYYVRKSYDRLYAKLMDISYGQRGACSWIELESQDNGYLQFPSPSTLSNEYQFGFPYITCILDGRLREISSTGTYCETCVIPISGLEVDLNSCLASKVRVTGDADTISSKNLNAEELYLDCDVKYFKGTDAFLTNKLKKVVFSKNTVVPSTYNPVTVPEDCVIVVPDALYDEWVASDDWLQVASQIVKASEYTEK